MHFQKQGKYPIINKSTTFAPFYYPYLNSLTSTLFFTRISPVNIFKVFFRKAKIPVKTGKPHVCLLSRSLKELMKRRGDWRVSGLAMTKTFVEEMLMVPEYSKTKNLRGWLNQSNIFINPMRNQTEGLLNRRNIPNPSCTVMFVFWVSFTYDFH